MLTFNTYIKTLQKYADNINVSNEAFFRTFFEYIVDKLDILTLDNEPYDFTKQRISALLNQKEDFSFKIRDAICHYTAKEKLLEIFPDIVDDLLNKQRLPALINDIKQLVIDDNSLSEEFKKEIQCSSNNEVLVNCFIQAIKVSNLQTKKQKTLWKSGNNSLKYVTGNLIDTSFNNKKDNKKIVVIPVNTSFETKLSNNIETELYPLVSENTIHGQWLKKILNIIKKEDLDKRIQSQLANKQIKPTGKSKA